MRKTQSILVCVCLLFTCLLTSNCQSMLKRNLPWEQVDIPLETLPVLKTDKKETSISDDFKQNHVVVMDKKGNLFFVKKTDMDIKVTKEAYIKKQQGYYGHVSYPLDGVFEESKFYPNELLNPKTFIGGSLASTLPMELFQINEESVKVDYKDQLYSVFQGGQAIMTATMIAYCSPWVFTSQHPLNHQGENWDYTVLNTETKYSVSISLPGLIQSVEKMDNHLLLKVVDQAFFRTSQWAFLTEENRVVSLGSNYAKVHMIGEYPESNWCIVSDWYNQELSVRNRTTFEKLHTLPLDKYLISGITPFQDNNKDWHVWIIPVLTVEKFTSNVFWISLKKNIMTIQNLDYYDPFLVATHKLDSEGNLYMIEEKQVDKEWNGLKQMWTLKDNRSIKKETNIIKVNPWKKKVQKLPIEWEPEKAHKEKEVLFYYPDMEMKADGILVRNFSNPYYLENEMQKRMEYYQAGIIYEEFLVTNSKIETIRAFDPITLQPITENIPVSDIIKGMVWADYLGRGIQYSLFIPYQSFNGTVQ